jgi:hypothetical protein
VLLLLRRLLPLLPPLQPLHRNQLVLQLDHAPA